MTAGTRPRSSSSRLLGFPHTRVGSQRLPASPLPSWGSSSHCLGDAHSRAVHPMALPSHDSWVSEGGHGLRRRRGMRVHIPVAGLGGAHRGGESHGLLENASCPRGAPSWSMRREGPDWLGWTPGGPRLLGARGVRRVWEVPGGWGSEPPRGGGMSTSLALGAGGEAAVSRGDPPVSSGSSSTRSLQGPGLPPPPGALAPERPLRHRGPCFPAGRWALSGLALLSGVGSPGVEVGSASRPPACTV